MAAEEFRTGDPLFTVDRSLTVTSWNSATERLTGVEQSEALGRRCWEILGGLGEEGDVICHAGCAYARLAREGFPVGSHALLVRTPTGRARVHISTVTLADGRLLHVLVPPRARRTTVELTGRQREVLGLIADGLSAKAIARRLCLAEPTVRTYIRLILRELGAHSQLEALAKARRTGVLQS